MRLIGQRLLLRGSRGGLSWFDSFCPWFCTFFLSGLICRYLYLGVWIMLQLGSPYLITKKAIDFDILVFDYDDRQCPEVGLIPDRGSLFPFPVGHAASGPHRDQAITRPLPVLRQGAIHVAFQPSRVSIRRGEGVTIVDAVKLPLRPIVDAPIFRGLLGTSDRRFDLIDSRCHSDLKDGCVLDFVGSGHLPVIVFRVARCVRTCPSFYVPRIEN